VAAVVVADENHVGGHAEIGEDGGIVAGPACHLDGGDAGLVGESL
jgi:hypothetical protein